jgi:hypothetical protein
MPAKPKTTQLNIREFPAELLKECKLAAAKRYLTLKNFVIDSLWKAVKEKP